MPLDNPEIIASALDSKASEKPSSPKCPTGAPGTRGPIGTTRKTRAKIHRPRKESTKTITTRLYKMWSEIVRHLAGNKCAICGESHPSLNSHHIIPRQICSGLRFAPENGICLCPKHHKFGKFSAHKNGVWFSEWLRAHDPEKHLYCVEHMESELDCKDRMALYKVENDLHEKYADFAGKLDLFDVTVATVEGDFVVMLISAANAKAAEFMVTQTCLADKFIGTAHKVKGVVSCKKNKVLK